MFNEVNLMREAVEEINQDYANWLLFEAWKEYRLADIFWDDEESEPTNERAYSTHDYAARKLYETWSRYTQIKFECGYHELHKFTEDDFAKFGLVW